MGRAEADPSELQDSRYTFACHWQPLPFCCLSVWKLPCCPDFLDPHGRACHSNRWRDLLRRRQRQRPANSSLGRPNLTWPGQKSNASCADASHGLSEELFRAWRKAIRTGSLPPAEDPPSQRIRDLLGMRIESGQRRRRSHEISPSRNSAARAWRFSHPRKCSCPTLCSLPPGSANVCRRNPLTMPALFPPAGKMTARTSGTCFCICSVFARRTIR